MPSERKRDEVITLIRSKRLAVAVAISSPKWSQRFQSQTPGSERQWPADLGTESLLLV